MSTQPFGQQPVFGSTPSFGQATDPAPVDEPEAGNRRRTVVIAVAAGVTALAVLGGAAALVLPGSDDEVVDAALPPAPVVVVEPSAPPSTTAAPLPTAVLGRNVFTPLLDDTAAAAAAEVVDPLSEPVATDAPTTSPTAVPVTSGTSGLTSAALPGFGSSVPLAGPPVTVTETVEVPGPTTRVPGPVRTVPGPTVTSPPEVIEVTVPGFHSLSVTVEEDLTDPEEPRHPATFSLVPEAGDEPVVFADKEPGDAFGPGNRFVYLSYSVPQQTLSFLYVDSIFTVSVVPATEAPPAS